MSKKMSKKKKKKVLIISCFSFIILCIVGVGGMVLNAMIDVNTAMVTMYAPVKTDNLRVDSGDSGEITHDDLIKAQKPFSVLLLGTDTGDFGRTETRGRSDTIIVCTINPGEGSVKMLSIPRDTRTEIVGRGTMDKINHAYAFGGAEMSINTVQKFLGIPIDAYAVVNFAGFQKIVDAVGGITVENTLDFSIDGYSFTKGTTELDGARALAYCRMRYDDPNGDFGRSERQRQVIVAIAKKALSFNSVANYKQILDSVADSVLTDMDFETLLSLATNYSQCVNNVTQLPTLKGQGTKIDGIYYYIADEAALAETVAELKAHLEID